MWLSFTARSSTRRAADLPSVIKYERGTGVLEAIRLISGRAFLATLGVLIVEGGYTAHAVRSKTPCETMVVATCLAAPVLWRSTGVPGSIHRQPDPTSQGRISLVSAVLRHWGIDADEGSIDGCALRSTMQPRFGGTSKPKGDSELGGKPEALRNLKKSFAFKLLPSWKDDRPLWVGVEGSAEVGRGCGRQAARRTASGASSSSEHHLILIEDLSHSP
ncbi:hypothetical protein DFH06DRAFT_1124534 [Mycena polygramma]|nr:hypothetical protein DFH06DRAFT_1124534 [Mycena polygramma]